MNSTVEVAEMVLDGEWDIDMPELADGESDYIVTNEGGGSSGAVYT